MDAVKYLKEAARMCDAMTGSCDDCPFYDWRVAFPCKSSNGWLDLANPEKCVEIIEKWTAEHPKKTRQSEFLKMAPYAVVEHILPCAIDKRWKDDECKRFDLCSECREEYWSEEVE